MENIDDIFKDYFRHLKNDPKLSQGEKNAKKEIARAWKKDIESEKLCHPYFAIYKKACEDVDETNRQKKNKDMAGSGSSGDDGDHASDPDFEA